MRRRSFLAGAAGLIVTFTLRAEASPLTVESDSVDAYLVIAPDGSATVYAGKVDIGTGARAAIRQIVAEELGMSPERIALIEGDTALTPNQGGTGGSTGIMVGGIQIRQAAATARQGLINLAAAQLKRAGWHTDVHLSFPESQCSDLLRKKITEFRDTPPVAAAVVAAVSAANPSRAHTIILDGLLGLGSKPPLRDPILAACREINRLRQERGAHVFAVDQPTGLNGDSGETDRNCVVADFTVTIAAAKRGLLADNATNLVGRLEVVPLSDLPLEAADETVACAASLQGLLPRRPFDAHKNQFGRVGIVAGSRGFAGAATMCAWGALRGGAGLVEVFVPENIYEIVAAAAPFESMVKPVKSYRD